MNSEMNSLIEFKNQFKMHLKCSLQKHWLTEPCAWIRIEKNNVLPLDLSYVLYCG